VSRVWLALGSNVGDRDGYLASARDALSGAGVSLRRASRIAETEPVGIEDQPPFLNQVLQAETALEPRALLETVKRIEQQLGRRPRERWGPREIDIDILRYENRCVEEPGLRIPHPELEHRPFLLELIAELERP
jgi:2-amino-4-hydroxy-6-hydroxymethyldihydropteridine diphosphokinase